MSLQIHHQIHFLYDDRKDSRKIAILPSLIDEFIYHLSLFKIKNPFALEVKPESWLLIAD